MVGDVVEMPFSVRAESLLKTVDDFPSCSYLRRDAPELKDALVEAGLYRDVVVPQLRDHIMEVCNKGECPYDLTEPDELIELARGYEGRTELAEEDPVLRDRLMMHGLWAAVLPPRKPKWTREKLRKEAAKFTSRSEFAHGSGAAYAAARRMELLDDLFPPKRPDTPVRWTERSVTKAAQRCETRTEFHRVYPGAYNFARSHGLLDKVCAHMKGSRNDPMSDEEIMEIAASHPDYLSFLRSDRRAYQQSVKRGLFPKIVKENGWVLR